MCGFVVWLLSNNGNENSYGTQRKCFFFLLFLLLFSNEMMLCHEQLQIVMIHQKEIEFDSTFG